jgi:hypothetical protein
MENSKEDRVSAAAQELSIDENLSIKFTIMKDSATEE